MSNKVNINGLNVDVFLLATIVKAFAAGKTILLLGPAGSGKTALARRLCEIVGGPARFPHHTVSKVGMVGNKDHGGECSLAHLGTLVLDELPEFRRDVLDAVRVVHYEGRENPPSKTPVVRPATFRVIGLANHCACGRDGGDRACQCSENLKLRYYTRLNEYANLFDMEQILVNPEDVAF